MSETPVPVPETGFLQKACVLALHNIVARLDRARDFQPYFKVILDPPARAVHDSWDYCDMAGRYVDAFALIRQVTAHSAPEEERQLRRFLLQRAHPTEGLFYNAASDHSEYVADMFCQSRVLIGLCTWFMDDEDEEALTALRRLVHGLIRIAERREDYIFYPRNLWREGEWLEGGLFYAPKDLWTVKPGYGGTQLEGMMKYYQLTGDEAVLPFVRGYLRYFLDTAKVVDEAGHFAGHLHSQGIVPTMIGATLYAEATGDSDLLARCERFLRFTLSHCSAFGWVPDGIGWPTCETCAVGDVIYLATYLSRLNRGDFWYDIERIARNQLLANQFREPQWVLAGRDPQPGLERLIHGSFASWARPSDLLGGPDLEGCCTGGGVRALFHVLRNSVGKELDGTLAVRMLFSVDTAHARVMSALPYEGRVEVRVKEKERWKLRLPEGAAVNEISVRVNGQEVSTASADCYLLLGELEVGDVVDLTFPLAIRAGEESVAGQTYRVVWKGNTVVGLKPEGSGYPTYRRSEWLEPTVPQSPWPYPVQGDVIRW